MSKNSFCLVLVFRKLPVLQPHIFIKVSFRNYILKNRVKESILTVFLKKILLNLFSGELLTEL